MVVRDSLCDLFIGSCKVTFSSFFFLNIYEEKFIYIYNDDDDNDSYFKKDFLFEDDITVHLSLYCVLLACYPLGYQLSEQILENQLSQSS